MVSTLLLCGSLGKLSATLSCCGVPSGLGGGGNGDGGGGGGGFSSIVSSADKFGSAEDGNDNQIATSESPLECL